MVTQAYRDVLSSLRRRLGALAEERAKLEHAIEAIEALIQPDSATQTELLAREPVTPSHARKTATESPTYAEAATAVLRTSAVPMHLRDIIQAAQGRGWFADKDVTDKNFANAVYSALGRRKDLFEKVGPSTYRLQAAHGNGSAPTQVEP